MSTARPRFLVVVRAGDASLHPTWIDASRPRRFDLVVSYYGQDPERYRDAPFRRVDDRGQKFHGLKELFLRDPFWRDYDWILLPDDDLATEQVRIERVFATAAAASLDLSQPSLDWHSHYSLGITLQSPSFALRYTDVVEVMVPCFSRAFLEHCLPTFDANLSGWGLSFVWPHLLGRGLRRCAILDEATVTHTRPVGGPAYDRLRAEGRSPAEERAALLARYGLPLHPRSQVYAAIDRDGRELDPSRPGDEDRYRRSMERDARQFATERARIEQGSLGQRPPQSALPPFDADRLAGAVRRLPFGPGGAAPQSAA